MAFIYSEEALADVDAIADYLANESGSINLVERFYDAVWQTAELVSAMPQMGAPIETLLDLSEVASEIKEILHALPLLEGLRRFPVTGFDNYLIFYKEQQDALHIVRVIHSSRDFPVIFSSID